MHDYNAYFGFSGIFLISLDQHLPLPKIIRILSALVFGPGSIAPPIQYGCQNEGFLNCDY